MEKKRSNKGKFFLILLGLVIGLCICTCIGFNAIGKWADSSPSVQATRTMRAIEQMTETAEMIAQATQYAFLTGTATNTSTPTQILISDANTEKFDGVSFTINGVQREQNIDGTGNQRIYIELIMQSGNIGWTGFDVKSSEVIIDNRSGFRQHAISVAPECHIYDDEICESRVVFEVPVNEENINLYYVSDKRTDGKDPVSVTDPDDHHLIAKINIQNIPLPPTPTSTATNTPTNTPTKTATIDPLITPSKTSTSTSTPSATPEPSPTETPPLTIGDIYYNFGHLTAFQFKEYKNNIMGEIVKGTVKIGNVSDNGNLLISGPWSSEIISIYDFCVTVNNVPKDTALSFSGGQYIYLEAIVYGLVGDYNYYYNCENALILKYVSHQ